MSYKSRLELIIDSRGSERDLRRFENRLGEVDRAGVRASDSMGRMNSRMDSIGRVAKVAGGALLGLTAGAGIFTAIARGASQSAREIQFFSSVANATTEEFQLMSFASAEFGVEQSKLADILKDVNDRVGEFIQTGSGEMSDFFEKIAPRVGVTADQFARLSGPEALQLYYQSLEDANLSQQEMTFYMESMADEASALIPLLRDNGAEMDRLAGEADKLNIVLSDVENRRLDELRGEFSQLEQQLSTETMRAVSQFDELMKSSLEGISMGVNDLARGFNVFMDSFRENDVKRSIAGIDAELHKLFDTKERLEQRIDMFGADSAQAQDSISALEDLRNEYRALIDRKKELQQSAMPVAEPEILQLERLGDGYKTLDQWLFQIPGSANNTTNAFADQSSAASELSNSLRSLEEQLFPLEAAQRQYRSEQMLLQTALMNGTIGIERYMDAWSRLQDAQRSGDNWQDAYGLDGSATKELEKMDGAAHDLGLTFESAFEDAIIGGEGFREVLSGIAEDIARIALRKGVTEKASGWLVDAISTGISAYSGGGGGTFASSYGSSSAGNFSGFSEGGYTGDGAKMDPAGVVHKGEFVVKKSVVDNPGVRPFLEGLNKGYASGGYVGGGSGGSVAPSITYAPQVTVQAQPGATQEDVGRQVKAFKQANKAQFAEFLREQQRPGGMLAKR